MSVHHVVLLELRHELSAAQETEMFVKIAGLLKQIPGVTDIKAGKNFTERAPNVTHAVIVTMKDKEALAGYGPHPKHVAVQAILKPHRKSLLVADFET